MARVVVVGGGLGGTASAARLAKLGHEVTLVETLPRLGGAIGFAERDGFRWDTGPSATAVPAVLRDLFRKSGRPLEREAELVPVEPMREHRFEDGTRLVLPSGSRAAQLAAVDDALGPGAGRRWVDYVHGFADPWDRLRRDWFERPYAPGVAAREAERLLRSRRTLHRLAHRTFRDPRLRALALHHAVSGGHDPRNVPAWLGLQDYLEQNFGTWTFPGGFGVLAGLLAKRLGERRVRVLTSTTATDLRMAGSGPVAVETDGGPLDADVVVVAVDPRRIPALAPHVRRTMPALPPTVVHLGLARDFPAAPREIVLHGECSVTVRTDGVAPEGKAAWTLLGRGRLSEDLLVALARRGVDVRDAVETRVDRSPRDLVEQWSGSPAGVLWQGRATVRDRVGPRTPLPGVYAAGAHTGGGGWVPFVGLAAQTTRRCTTTSRLPGSSTVPADSAASRSGQAPGAGTCSSTSRTPSRRRDASPASRPARSAASAKARSRATTASCPGSPTTCSTPSSRNASPRAPARRSTTAPARSTPGSRTRKACRASTPPRPEPSSARLHTRRPAMPVRAAVRSASASRASAAVDPTATADRLSSTVSAAAAAAPTPTTVTVGPSTLSGVSGDGCTARRRPVRPPRRRAG
jgi:phytoene dehydrogenase-like protein